MRVSLLFHVVKAGFNANEIRFNDRRLSTEGVLENRFDSLHVDAKEVSEGAHIDHVSLFNPKRRGGHDFLDQLISRDPKVLNPISLQVSGERGRVIVENDAAIPDAIDIFGGSRVIKHDHDVDDVLSGHVSVSGGPDLIPGRQPLNIRREHIL